MQGIGRRFRAFFSAPRLAAFILLGGAGCVPSHASDAVTLLQTPNGGIQPQAVVDATATLHLIYFKGDPAHGDLFYVHKKLGQDAPFSAPLRVNSHPRSAIATGAIRGGQIAVGKNGRVFVLWNGSDQAPKAPFGPLEFTRLNDGGTAFEPERNIVSWSGHLDGGSSLAADTQGGVYVTWHTAEMGRDDAQDSVFLTHSSNDGKTFAREWKINTQPTGACGCCSMRAFVDRQGVLYILYRTADQSIHRDTTLLVSRDTGKSFKSSTLQPWQINACPMSMFSLTESRSGVLGAWETRDQVYYASLNAGTVTSSPPVAAPGAPGRKYPVIVAAANGQTLLAWAEGVGWARGGALAWQVYDAQGRPTAAKGRVENGVAVWSMPAAVARQDGTFLIVY